MVGIRIEKYLVRNSDVSFGLKDFRNIELQAH